MFTDLVELVKRFCHGALGAAAVVDVKPTGGNESWFLISGMFQEISSMYRVVEESETSASCGRDFGLCDAAPLQEHSNADVTVSRGRV